METWYRTTSTMTFAEWYFINLFVVSICVHPMKVPGAIHPIYFYVHIKTSKQYNSALLYIFVCRTIIHYRRGLYHGYGAHPGSLCALRLSVPHYPVSGSVRVAALCGSVYINLPGQRLRLTRPSAPTHLLSGRVKWCPSKIYFIGTCCFCQRTSLSLPWSAILFMQGNYL